MLKGILISSLVLLVALAATGCDWFKPEAPSPIKLELFVESAESGVERGDTVSLELRVWKFSVDELRLRSRPAHDFVITTEDGQEIWRWSHGRTIEDKTYVLTQQGALLTGEWDQRDNQGLLVLPGTYWVKGILNLVQQQFVSKPARLIVQPGSPLTLQLQIPSLITMPKELMLHWKYGLPYWKPGLKMPLKMTLRNRSDQPVSLKLKGRPAYDFVVTQAGGHEIWRWSDSTLIEDVIDQKTLQPREELELVAEWNQQNREGELVTPGRYGIQGFVYFVYTKQLRPLQAEGAVVIGKGLPLQLSLQAPAEIESGKELTLKLRIKNVGEKALKLSTGAASYDFIVTDHDGQEIWRWSYGKQGFPAWQQYLTLRRGETEEHMITWAQIDNEGYPVPPGAYWVRGIFRTAEADAENLEEIALSEPQPIVIKP
jgi:hypothetical protein